MRVSLFIGIFMMVHSFGYQVLSAQNSRTDSIRNLLRNTSDTQKQMALIHELDHNGLLAGLRNHLRSGQQSEWEQ